MTNPAHTASMSARDKTLRSCRQLMDAGQYTTAIPLLRERIASEPRNPLVLRMLGHALVLLDHAEEGVRHLELSSRLDPGDLDTFCDLATGLRRLDRVGPAHKALDHVLKERPTHARAVSLKARLLQSRGQSDKALEIIRAAMGSPPEPSIVTVFADLSLENNEPAPAIDLIREQLRRPDMPRHDRMDMLFSLGHMLDAVGEYDEAFDAIRSANEMNQPGKPFDFDSRIGSWTREAIENLPVADTDASRAVLVVGMPRSGTTLTEQILGAHPEAGGVGESPVLGDLCRGKNPAEFADPRVMNSGAELYLGSLAEAYPDPSVRRVIDKMPGNAFYLGCVQPMLPGASVIHCTRDPRDTCLSIYFQRFGPGLAYANDLRACAEQYLGHIRLMAHWRETLGIPILDSSYEALTSDPEPRVRALLEHIGLGFHKACMEHHKSKSSVHTASVRQVRRPVYTSSTARWKRYEKHLGPMLEVLGDLGADAS